MFVRMWLGGRGIVGRGHGGRMRQVCMFGESVCRDVGVDVRVRVDAYGVCVFEVSQCCGDIISVG